jgi:hypothetical protein
MNLDDSDSSLEDLSEFTRTNVNLGYASKEATGDAISHLGGFPVRPIAFASLTDRSLTE